jgi:hypothetical protein
MKEIDRLVENWVDDDEVGAYVEEATYQLLDLARIINKGTGDV